MTMNAGGVIQNSRILPGRTYDKALRCGFFPAVYTVICNSDKDLEDKNSLYIGCVVVSIRKSTGYASNVLVF